MKEGGRAVVVHALGILIGVESETEVVGFDAFLRIVRDRDRDRGCGHRDVDGCGVYLFGDHRLQGLLGDRFDPDEIFHSLFE